MRSASRNHQGEDRRERPRLSGVAVQWGDPGPLRELLDSWPDDPRFELIVVDNGEPPLPAGIGSGFRVLRPERNLGFAGAANLGIAEARADLVLVLNSDAAPEPGALEAILSGFEEHPRAAGLAPRMTGLEGEGQWRWQLRKLPTWSTLWLQALLIPVGDGPADEPEPGAKVEQPAAAALALRRSAFKAVGGFDDGFFPAWFEDVDLALRLRVLGLELRYLPQARFRHQLGSSVPALGFGPFLWIYYRNLTRYLAKHHGRPAAAGARWLLVAASFLRMLLLPLRRPRRARSRWEAAAGLLRLGLGASSAWRRPRPYAARFSPENSTA